MPKRESGLFYLTGLGSETLSVLAEVLDNFGYYLVRTRDTGKGRWKLVRKSQPRKSDGDTGTWKEGPGK